MLPILEEILANTDKKVILFSEWERMLLLLKERLDAKGLSYGFHSGSMTQKERRVSIESFKNDPECRLFLSTDSGSVGLNLQAASVVINLDIPWNPAKLEQRIARAWRKHQKNSVQIINLITENSIENKILYLIKQKQNLSDSAIDGRGEDSQPIPRNKKAFLDQVKSLYEEHPSDMKQKSTPESFLQDLLSRYEERVEMVAKSARKNILIVIDKKDDKVINEISSLGSEKLQILSKEEYALVDKLQSMGMLSIDKKLKVLFDRNASREKKDTKALEKRLKKIRKLHKAIELFKQSGLKKEAMKQMCINSSKLLKYLIQLNGQKGKKITPAALKELKSRYLFDDSFDQFFEAIQTKCRKKEYPLIERYYLKLFDIAVKTEV